MTIEALLAEAKALDLLGHIRRNDVHCPNCQARLGAFGECPTCGLVGSSEQSLRAMDPKTASALLERSITRRKAYVPQRRGAKSGDR